MIRFALAGLRVCPVILLVSVAWSSPVRAQPNIDHPGIECIEPGKFAVILSGIDPNLEVQTAKVYFRSNLYPDFYYVEMTYDDGRFQGILPRPSPETTQIIYYLEAIDGVFNGTRSLEWDPLVQECDDDPAAVYFTGEETGIVIGATTAGQSAIPAGFSAAGIIGTIAATGVATGVGGGIGAGTAVAVGAVAAGAAAGAVVATGGGEEEPTTTAVAAVTTTTPAATTTLPATPDPGPSSTSVPQPGSTTTVGSTTTITGSTTTSAGGASTSTTTIPGTSTTTIVTTTIATTTVALPPLDAGCFSIQVTGDCKVRVDATCVNLPVDRYEWILDIDDKWQRVTISNGPSIVIQSWSSSCGEDDKSIRFQLTVHRGANSDTSVKSKVVRGNDFKTVPDAPGNARRARFESHLDLPGSARGRIVVNGASGRIIDNAQPVVIDGRATGGVSTVVATVIDGADEPGVWRFDFRNEPRFVGGSLRIVRGNVLTLAPNAVVFRLNGRSAEGIAFTYELHP